MPELIDKRKTQNEIALIAKYLAKSDAQKAIIGRILFMIDHMPTIETEVRRGRWKTADLIDRDAVLSILAGLARTQGEYDASYDKLMQIPPANRWISVEDALSEQDGFYLAYFTFKDGTHATDIAYINTGCNLGSITHWMPMPEPPEVFKQ